MANETARLEKVIAHDRAMTHNFTATNRRTWPRYPSGVKGDCRPAGTSPTDHHWPVEVLNVSRAGIGLRINQPFEPGTPLVMEIEPAPHEDSRMILARVTRTRQLTSREWELGCILTHELKASDLLALAQPDVHVPAEP